MFIVYHQNHIFNKFSQPLSNNFTVSSWKINHGLNNDHICHWSGGGYAYYWECMTHEGSMTSSSIYIGSVVL